MFTRLQYIVCFTLSALFSVSLACASDFKSNYNNHFNPPVAKLIKSYQENYIATAIRLTHSEHIATTKYSLTTKTVSRLFYQNLLTQIASDIVFRPEKSYLGLGWGNRTAVNNKSQLGFNFDAGLLVTNDSLLTSDIKAAARSFNRNHQAAHHMNSTNTVPATLPDDLMVLPMLSASISLVF